MIAETSLYGVPSEQGRQTGRIFSVHPSIFFALAVFQMGIILIWSLVSPFLALVVAAALLYGILLIINIRWAWLSVILLFPFSREVLIPGFQSALQIPTEPLIFVFAFAFVLFFLQTERTSITSSSLNIPIGLFLIVIFSSVLYSRAWVLSAKTGANLCWYVLIGYLFPLNFLTTMGDLKRVVKMLLVSAILVSCFGLAHMFFSNISIETLKDGVYADLFFRERGSYSAYLSFYFAVALSFLLHARGRTRRLQWGVVVSLLGFAILLSFARAAWIGILCLLIAIGLIKLKKILRFRNIAKLVFVILCIGLVMLSTGVKNAVERRATTITDVEENLSNLERIHRWMAAIHMFQGNPILGVGAGNYQENYPFYRVRSYMTPLSYMDAGVHNEHLTILAEDGLLGFIVWLYMIGSLFFFGVKICQRTQDPYLKSLTYGLLGGFFTYMIHGLFNDYISYDKIAIPFWLTFGLIAVIHNRVQKEDNSLTETS